MTDRKRIRMDKKWIWRAAGAVAVAGVIVIATVVVFTVRVLKAAEAAERALEDDDFDDKP